MTDSIFESVPITCPWSSDVNMGEVRLVPSEGGLMLSYIAVTVLPYSARVLHHSSRVTAYCDRQHGLTYHSEPTVAR